MDALMFVAINEIVILWWFAECGRIYTYFDKYYFMSTCNAVKEYINTLRSEQNGQHCADYVFKCILI